MSNALPSTWAIVSLLDVAPLVPTGVPNFTGEVEYYSTGSVQEGGLSSEGRYTFESRPSRANRWTKPGDVLQARMQGTSKPLLVHASIADKLFSTGFIQLRPDPRFCNPGFLRHYIASKVFLDDRDSLATGSTQIALTDAGVRGLEIPLAPLNEQRRIVAKLEKLLAKVDACQHRLGKIPVLLKRFRQSVLAAACSGRFTVDWREVNRSPTNYAEEELPLGWRTALVGEVIKSLKYGTSQKCSYEKRGVPVLRIPNIDQGVVNQSDLKYAELRDKEFQQLCLQSGDILMIRSNGSVSLVGRSALVREIDKGFAYAGYLIRLRPDFSKIIPDFLNLVLGSHDVRIQIEVPARSTSGVHNINSEEVRALQFFLPPVGEQQEIVRRVETLFNLADTIEKRVAAASLRAEKLTQAILAKAFRGELVPTEAELARREGRSYESASDLLARIKSERATKSMPIRIFRKRGLKNWKGIQEPKLTR